MALIELNQFALSAEKKGYGIHPCDFWLKNGDVVQLRTDSINDAHLLFKGLATLAYPSEGTYIFKGHKLDFCDYRQLLNIKKKIGYLASDTALISNRTIRENLCMGHVYFDNDLSNKLDEETLAMCRDFGLTDILNERPTHLGVNDNHRSMLVREWMKSPELMLVEYPKSFSGQRHKDRMIDLFQTSVSNGMILVYLSFDPDFIQAFPGHILNIREGRVTLLKQ